MNNNIIEDVIIFLNKLKKAGSPKLKKNINSIIEGIEAGDLLKEFNVRVD